MSDCGEEAALIPVISFIGVVLSLYANQEEPSVLRMLKSATRPRMARGLLEMGFGSLARSILEEMRSIREEVDAKTMEAFVDADAEAFELGEEAETALQEAGILARQEADDDGTTGALREHIVCSSVLKKRRRKMRRHKHKKRLRKNRYKSRR